METTGQTALLRSCSFRAAGERTGHRLDGSQAPFGALGTNHGKTAFLERQGLSGPGWEELASASIDPGNAFGRVSVHSGPMRRPSGQRSLRHLRGQQDAHASYGMLPFLRGRGSRIGSGIFSSSDGEKPSRPRPGGHETSSRLLATANPSGLARTKRQGRVPSGQGLRTMHGKTQFRASPPDRNPSGARMGYPVAQLSFGTPCVGRNLRGNAWYGCKDAFGRPSGNIARTLPGLRARRWAIASAAVRLESSAFGRIYRTNRSYRTDPISAVCRRER
jgi:hypothetical protein